MTGINPLLLLTLGIAVSMLLVPVLSRFAPRLGLIDLPDARKVHVTPVPRVGGWGIAIGGLVPVLLSFTLDPLLQSFVFGTTVLFVFGVWDDARELGHWTKFFGQVLAVAAVVFYGDLYVMRLPFVDADWLSPLAGKCFTMFALIGAINAINHSDGLDGLAAGEALLTLIAMAVLAYVVGDTLAVGVSLAMMGGLLGFLRYNSHPARVFMGDCGSQVLGFTLGFLVVYLTQVAHTALSAALPLLLLGLPIADILAVLYQRIRAGNNWFRATRNHVHHRLLALGFNHYQTVIVIYSIQAVLVIGGVLLRYEADTTVAGVYVAVVGALFVALSAAERSAWRVRNDAGALPRIEAAVRYVTQNRLVRRAPFGIISALVPAVMLFVSVWAAQVPRDFAIAAGVLAAVVLAETLRARAGRSPLARAAVYAAAIFCAYLLISYPRIDGVQVHAATLATMAVLAVAVAAYVRFATKQEFGTTPTDYLVVFGVLALIVFGAVDTSSRAIVELVAFATILLYGCEVVLGRGSRRWPVLHVSAFATLAILALRGVL